MRQHFLHNLSGLYLAQISAALLSLIQLPYLSRVLGPVPWGLMLFSQAIAIWIALIVEYGFGLSATRQLARSKSDISRMFEIISGVWSAQIVLILLSISLWVALYYIIADFRTNILLWGAGLFLSVLMGFNTRWLFQGIERVPPYTYSLLVGRAITLVGVFTLVRGPGDAWLALLLQSIGYCAVAAFAWYFVAKRVGIPKISLKLAVHALNDGLSLFLFRAFSSLYKGINTIIVGVLLGPTPVAMYGSGEKIVKGGLLLLAPVIQAVFPRISRHLETSKSRAAREARISLGVMLGLSIAGALISYFFAPLIVKLVLGPGYEKAVPVLRILCFLIPVVSVSNVLGEQWMIPLKMDSLFTRISFIGAVINLVLAFVLAGFWGTVGVAIAIVAAESTVTLAVLAVLFRQKSLLS